MTKEVHIEDYEEDEEGEEGPRDINEVGISFLGKKNHCQ